MFKKIAIMNSWKRTLASKRGSLYNTIVSIRNYQKSILLYKYKLSEYSVNKRNNNNVKVSLLEDKSFMDMISKPISSHITSEYNRNKQSEKLLNLNLLNNERDEQTFKQYISNLILSGKVDEGINQLFTRYPTTSISDGSNHNTLASFEMYEFLIGNLVRVNRMDLAESIYYQLIGNDCQPTVSFMKNMLKAALRMSSSKFFEDILQVMKEKKIQFDEGCYILAMKHYARKKNLTKVQEIFKEICNSGIKYGDEVYSILIQLYFKNNQEAKGWELFDIFKRNYVYPSPHVSRTIVHHVAMQLNDMKRAKEIINHLPNGILSSDHYMSVVFAYLKNQMFREAFATIQSMKHRNITPTLKLYAPFLRECSTKGDLKRLNELLNILLKEQIITVNDMCFYLYRIECYARLGKMDKARSLYQELLDKNMSPSLSIVIALLRNYLDNDMVKEANELLNDYCAQMEKIHPHIYAEFIRFEIKRNNLKEAIRLLEVMKSEGTTPKKNSYKLIMCHLIKSGNVEEAFNMLSRMEEDGVAPDYSTLLSILAQLCYSHFMDEAKEFFDIIPSKYGYFHDAQAYEIIIHGYSNYGDLESALWYYNRMKKTNIQPNVSLYSAVISSYILIGDEANAEALYQEIVNNGQLKPNTKIYHQLIQQKIAKRKLNQAIEYYRRMTKEHGLIPFPHIFYSVFIAFLEQNNITQALEVVKTLVDTGEYIAGPAIYENLSKSYMNIGANQKAEEANAHRQQLIEKYSREFGMDSHNKEQPRVASMAFIPIRDSIFQSHLNSLDFDEQDRKSVV